jgi:hypothetical protein
VHHRLAFQRRHGALRRSKREGEGGSHMKRSLLSLLSIAALITLLGACTQGAIEPNAISYALSELNDSGISGTVTFDKMTDEHTAVIINVDGTTAGQMYPAHIHVGSHPGGAIYISLSEVDGDTGNSVTIVTETDPGQGSQPVDYEFLVDYDGYLNIHDPANLANLYATGETGLGADDVQVNP